MKYEEAERKLNEYRTLTNKLKRYWKKLAKESLRVAKQQGLETVVTNEDIHLKKDIMVRTNGKEINVSELFKLAKPKFQALYRKYSEGIEKHKEIESMLRKYLEN